MRSQGTSGIDGRADRRGAAVNTSSGPTIYPDLASEIAVGSAADLLYALQLSARALQPIGFRKSPGLDLTT